MISVRGCFAKRHFRRQVALCSLAMFIVAAFGAWLVVDRGATRLAQAAVPIPVTVQSVAVPSYIHPLDTSGAWDRLVTTMPGAVGIAVANVMNGPGSAVSTDWTTVMQRARSAGAKVLGYVDTGYLGTTGQTTRSGSSQTGDWMDQVQADIDTWYALYGTLVDGILFDQAQSSCGPTSGSNAWADMYAQLHQYQKTAHSESRTVLNPGMIVPQCFENAADTLITFESSYAAYAGAGYQDLNWVPQDPLKIWHLVYGATTSTQMQDAIARSKQHGAGYVYVTDDVLPNPWDTIPNLAYWQEELQLATAGMPTTTTTTTTTTTVPVTTTVPTTTSTTVAPTTTTTTRAPGRGRGRGWRLQRERERERQRR